MLNRRHLSKELKDVRQEPVEMRRVFSTEKKALRHTSPEVRVCMPYLRNGLQWSWSRATQGSDRGNKDPEG